METLKAIVNLKTLYDNLQIIKSRTKAMIYAVVKANAYGHGMCVATFLQPYVDGFCVATFGEAEMLVGYAVYKPIIVLSEVSDGCQILPHENVVYSVGSESSAAIIRQVNPKAPFYIKVNSGMNRLGCDMEELPKIMNYVRHNNLNCLGASTHFFNSDSKECAEHQFKRFQTAIAECVGAAGKLSRRHYSRRIGFVRIRQSQVAATSYERLCAHSENTKCQERRAYRLWLV